MRKTLIYGITALVSLGASSAMAEVDVLAYINKDKDVIVTEYIDITKDVYINTVIDLNAEKAAESEALINQENIDNLGCSNCAEKKDIIQDSGNDNQGVLSINQATGNMNNQGNAVAAAVDVRTTDGGGGTPEDSGFAESQAAAEQMNYWNDIWAVNLAFRDATIHNSFNGNSGIVHFNQSPGNMNNQANALSLAVSFAANGVALSEADLGQFNYQNDVNESNDSDQTDIGINKVASLTTSLNNNTGIVGGNQSAGNMANQANIVSFSAAQLVSAPPPAPAP